MPHKGGERHSLGDSDKPDAVSPTLKTSESDEAPESGAEYETGAGRD